MDELIKELKEKIITTLHLIDITPAEIDEDDQLIGGKLEIDSIDILELVMMIEATYGIKIDNKELGEKVFASLATMAKYIHDNSPKVN